MVEEIDLKRVRAVDALDAKKEAGDLQNDEISFSNLFSLVRHGHFEELNLALKKGCDPDIMDDDGNTLLIIAAQNNQLEITKLLLNFGAKIDMVNSHGNMALHFCSEYGYHSLGKYLVMKKANPFIKNMNGIFAYQGCKTVHSTIDDYGLSEKTIKEIRQAYKMKD